MTEAPDQPPADAPARPFPEDPEAPHAPEAAPAAGDVASKGIASGGGPRFRPWLHGFALILMLWMFVLLTIGGNVTSLGAGMSVPDWPGSFGYNMFLAPLDKWLRNPDTGEYFVGRFWEHFHRLNGAAVGLLTIGLAVWLWQTQKHRDWLRWVGVALLGGVIVQGFMGGFRVAENSELLAAIHGVLGQLLFCGTVLVVAATGRLWSGLLWRQRARPTPPQRRYPIEAVILIAAPILGLIGAIAYGSEDYTATLRTWYFSRVGAILTIAMAVFFLIATPRLAIALKRVWATGDGLKKWSWAGIAATAVLVALVIQLSLGAAVRHTGSATAIPDAPLAYGHLAPPSSPAELTQDIAAMPDQLKPQVTPELWQVHLHYTHRAWAFVVVLAAVWLLIAVVRGGRVGPLTIGPMMLMLATLGLQILLGVMTVWSGIYPTMATFHQATGAALLGVTTWLVVRVHLAGRLSLDIGNEEKAEVGSMKSENPSIGQSSGIGSNPA